MTPATLFARAKTTGAGALLPIADMYRDGVAVRRDGALVRVAALGSLNPWTLSPEEGDRVIDAIGRALAQMPAGAQAVWIAEASPIRLNDVLKRAHDRARSAVQYGARTAAEALDIARLYALREEGLRQHAREDATIHYTYYLVVPYRPRGMGRSVRAAALPTRAHQEALRELDGRMTRLQHALRTQGIPSTQLDGQAFARALWAQANPTSADRAALQREVADVIASTTSAEGRSAEAAAERARDVQARLCLADFAEERDRGRWLRVEDDLHVTLMMSSKPQTVSFGWMAPAMQIGHPFRFAVHMRARGRAGERRRLHRERNLLHSAASATLYRGGSTNPVNDAHHGEVNEINARLANGEQIGFVDVALYQTIRIRRGLSDADVSVAIDVAKRTRDEIVTQTQAGVTLGEGEQLPGWQATTLLGHDPVRRTHEFTSDTAAALLPIWGTDVGSADGIEMFHTSSGGLQLWDPMPETAENFISFKVGAQGSGKTFLEIQQELALLSLAIPGFVIDTSEPESHFKPAAQLVGGAVLELGRGSSEHRLNPWDVDTSLGDTAERMPEKIQFIVDLHAALLQDRHAASGYGLDNIDEGLMLTAVETVYRWAQQDARYRPCESLLHHALRARAEQEDETDPEIAARLRRLASQLEQYVGSGQKAWLLDQPSTLPAHGALMTVFDMRACPETLRPAMTMIVMDHIIDRARARRRAVELQDGRRYRWEGATWVHVEEAAGQIDNEASGRQLNFFGRKTRHLGIRASFGTQRLQDFDTPWGRALLSSATEQYFLSQRPKDYPILEELAGLSPHELELIRTHVSMARGVESRFFWVNGEKRGLASLRAGTGSYWAATSHPLERPLRERALRRAGGDPWRALEIMPELRAAELKAAS